MDGETITHTHLDQARRDRGECPACDVAWDRQDARLTATRPSIAVTKQLDRMADKPARHPPRFCQAMKVLPPPENIHTCSKPIGHRDVHVCPLCDAEWTV